MRKYPDELKREALNLAARPGMKVAQVERDCSEAHYAGSDLQVAATVSGGQE